MSTDEKDLVIARDDYIAVSFISQYLYCPRRAGLMLLEQQWEENLFTAEGEVQHQRVHEEGREVRPNLVRLTGLALISHRLGLNGKADCVELISDEQGIGWEGIPGTWAVVPVEYKHGIRRNELEYEAQVCAQAICLEEMLGCVISEGYIFYEAERRRKKVDITATLRNKTEEASRKLHEMLASKVTPAAIKTPRCKGCSLKDNCLPELNRSTGNYIHDLVVAAKGDGEV